MPDYRSHPSLARETCRLDCISVSLVSSPPLTAPAPHPRARRTQEERSAHTRSRLLDATVESLIEVGYARTTTTEVCDRAGLSRGAQLHHFPTKAELVVAAVAHLAERRFGEMFMEAKRLAQASRDPLEAALDLIWASFQGPLFHAALELWVAARTDVELHASLYRLERDIGRAMRGEWSGLLPDPIVGGGRFDDVLELSFYVMRGMALQRILRDDDTERRRLFDVWKRMVREYLRENDRSVAGRASEPMRSREEGRP